MPETTYGTTKVMLELLVNDYTRKGYLDGRSARLPTVIVRPGEPNLPLPPGSAPSSASRSTGAECVLPVGLDMRTPVGRCPNRGRGAEQAARRGPGALGPDRAVTFPSVSVHRRARWSSACAGGPRAGSWARSRCGPTRYRADLRELGEARELRAGAALGIPLDESLDAIVRAYVEDYL